MTRKIIQIATSAWAHSCDDDRVMGENLYALADDGSVWEWREYWSGGGGCWLRVEDLPEE